MSIKKYITIFSFLFFVVESNSYLFGGWTISYDTHKTTQTLKNLLLKAPRYGFQKGIEPFLGTYLINAHQILIDSLRCNFYIIFNELIYRDKKFIGDVGIIFQILVYSFKQALINSGISETTANKELINLLWARDVYGNPSLFISYINAAKTNKSLLSLLQSFIDTILNIGGHEELFKILNHPLYGNGRGITIFTHLQHNLPDSIIILSQLQA